MRRRKLQIVPAERIATAWSAPSGSGHIHIVAAFPTWLGEL
jgi:hypothetical protein